MAYVLESREEFDRLERQSKQAAYDYSAELAQLQVSAGSRVLDAGCGSGVVSRYLAKRFPDSEVMGCDFSAHRIEHAQFASQNIKNLRFEKGDLTSLNSGDGTYDVIVCRYVIEHLQVEQRMKVMREFFRCLKPGGQIVIVDFDGLFFNTFPVTPWVERGLQLIQASPDVDLRVGRKIPNLLAAQGFENLSWSVQTTAFQGDELKSEIQVISERISVSQVFFEHLFGNEVDYRRFEKEYLDGLRDDGAVVFNNKFIVSAKKPA